MNRQLCYSFLITVSLLLFACQQSVHQDEKASQNQNDIFDFKHIEQAPEASELQSITKVIKVFFDESTFDKPYEAVAIDIKNNEIYVNPIISRRGLRAQDGVVPISNAEKVLDILKKYDVQTWEKEYASENNEAHEDGYSWRLLIQYEDGSVEKHKGNEEDNVPNNFDDFAEELKNFTEEKTKEN